MIVQFQPYSFIGPLTRPQADFQADILSHDGIAMMGEDAYGNQRIMFWEVDMETDQNMDSVWTIEAKSADMFCESVIDGETQMAYLYDKRHFELPPFEDLG